MSNSLSNAVGAPAFNIDWANPIAITDTANLTIGRHHIVTVTAADKALTLPAVSGNTGKQISIEIAAGTTKLITIDGNASETIDGALTRIMWASETCILFCTGATWTKIGGKSIPFIGGISLISTNYSFGGSGYYKIPCATPLFSNAYVEDTANNRLLAPRGGNYFVSHGIMYNNNNGTAGMSLSAVYVNGVLHDASKSYAYRPASLNALMSASGVVSPTAGQAVELYGYFSGGSFATTTTQNLAVNATRVIIQELISW